MKKKREDIENKLYLYFAYGSNMSLRRLQQRVPSAQKYCRAQLYKHQLRFHKWSRVDGSAKCDACYTDESSDCVEGILFRIDADDKRRLDNVEGVGHGYESKHVRVVDENEHTLHAYTYIATEIDASLKPYDWYKQHVLNGAKEHHLPVEYIEQIDAIQAQADSDTKRAEREMAIHNLDDKALSGGHGT